MQFIKRKKNLRVIIIFIYLYIFLEVGEGARLFLKIGAWHSKLPLYFRPCLGEEDARILIAFFSYLILTSSRRTLFLSVYIFRQFFQVSSLGPISSLRYQLFWSFFEISRTVTPNFLAD